MKNKLLAIFFLALLFRLILSFVTWHPDVNNHIDWGIRFFDYGPKKFYAPESNVWSYTWPNQPPGTIYIYAGIRKLFEFVFNIFWIINVKVPAFPSIIVTYFESNLYPALLKLPSIFSDIGIGYLIFLIVKTNANKKKALLGSLMWLVNPVIWYNSSVWGQTDSIISFLALLAFYLLSKSKFFLSILVLVISFYIKVSLLIFLPLYAIYLWKQKIKVSKILLSFATSLVLIALLTLPFSKGEPLSWLFELYKTKVLGQQLHVITANAFNIWAALTGIHEQPNSKPLLFMSFEMWGSVLFTLSYLPVIYALWKKPNFKMVIWSLAIVSFSSWMLLTNMHERYLYPLFPYLTILTAINSVALSMYILVSAISLLNLYNYWWMPKIDFVVSLMSFGNRLMPRILGLINFGIFVNFYTKYFKSS